MDFYQKSLEIIKKDLKEFQEGVGLEHYGVATNIIDPHNFYIVPLMCHRNMLVLEQPGKPYENVSENTIVIYYSPKFKQYVRGEVQNVQPNKICDIYAMDYGVIESVEPDKIFTPLVKEALDIPPLAQLCELIQCYPPGKSGVFSELQIIAFKELMGDGEKLTITIREKTSTKYKVDVMSSASNPSQISTVMFITDLTIYLPS